MQSHNNPDSDSSNPSNLEQLAIVIVSYNPDLDILARQLAQLPIVAFKIIVDNASQREIRQGILRITEQHEVVLLQNESNAGLAAALNQGAVFAQKARPGCSLLLFLDQDTEPGTGGVEQLYLAYQRVYAWTGRLCCIGPRLIDCGTGLEHGFHQIRGWFWIRCFPTTGSRAPIPVANLNGSGTLIPMAMFNQLEGLEAGFFIDHVDTEWAFRVIAAGYQLFGVPDIAFTHRMGEKSLRFWCFGWRVWPYRSAMRHRYLFRNAVWLMRRNYVPMAWKCWAVVKLTLTLLVHLTFDGKRFQQIGAMTRGVRCGLCTTANESEGEIP